MDIFIIPHTGCVVIPENSFVTNDAKQMTPKNWSLIVKKKDIKEEKEI